MSLYIVPHFSHNCNTNSENIYKKILSDYNTGEYFSYFFLTITPPVFQIQLSGTTPLTQLVG